jgi:transcription termination/antitermination protein NusG
MTSPEPLQSGDRVRILDGAFQHFIGVVQAFDRESGKVQVELSLFNRKSSIALKVLQVAKVK